MLTDTLNSSGSARHYEYDKELLISVRDEQGHTLVENRYRSGVLIGQTYGNGNVYRYQYVRSPEGNLIGSVFVTLPDGRSQRVDTLPSIPEYIRDLD